ncbi:hypothetical protein V6N13_052110 [Hibiscus sabdariffa]
MIMARLHHQDTTILQRLGMAIRHCLAVVDDTVEQAGDAPEAAEFVSTPTVAVNEAAKLDVVTTTLPQAVVEDNQHLEPAMSLSTSLTTPLITEGTASSITLGATFCMPKRSIQGRYEVCFPIQAKRPCIPLLSSLCMVRLLRFLLLKIMLG